MKRYSRKLKESNSIEEIIFKITSGTGLVDRKTSQQEYNIIKEWSKTQSKPKGLIYRVIWVELSDFYNKHIYDAHQKNNLQKDEPILIKPFESWTKDKNRVYSYGNPTRRTQDTVLLIMDASKIKCVDISQYSKYPFEQEVRNLEKILFKIKNVEYTSAGWQLFGQES